VSLKLPAIMGNEFAGDVVAVGSGITQFAVGDKV
jgi:NADPH:quinone reductase-like Zn-dependent oxidoreductase